MSRQFIKTDEYGREFFAAPTGMVLKAYAVHHGDYIKHCLIDEWGSVFNLDQYGWGQHQGDYTHLVVFPNPVPRGNDSLSGYPNRCWNWDGWYERNWQCDSWAWVYCKHADGRYIN